MIVQALKTKAKMHFYVLIGRHQGGYCLKVYDYIFIAFFALAFLFILLVLLITGRKMKGQKLTEQVNFYIEKRNIFLWVSIIWRSVDYLLSTASFLATIIVIYITAFMGGDSKHIFIYSVISLLLLIINLTIQPRELAHGYRKAYIRIDCALNRYLDGPTDHDPLGDTMDKCEKILLDLHR